MEFLALPLLAAFGKSLLFVLAGILPIINPLASAPLFVDLTHGIGDNTRAMLARRVGKNVGLLLAGAMLVGSYVLLFFGISLPVVRVAGGLVVASIAWRMLNAQQITNDDAGKVPTPLTDDKARMKAFYPLTFPLTCGPGSIAVAIALGASLHTKRSVAETVANMAGGLFATALLGVLVAMTYRYASRLLQRMGENGQLVFLRLMAFILLCIGVEILWDGIQSLVLALMAEAAVK